MKRELTMLMVVPFLLGAVPTLFEAQQEKRPQPGPSSPMSRSNSGFHRCARDES